VDSAFLAVAASHGAGDLLKRTDALKMAEQTVV